MIAIWGGGNIGREVYWKLKREGCDIEVFYDSDASKWNKKIDNVQIKEYKDENYFIIIATIYWKDIESKLESFGKKIIKDFVPYWMIENEISYEEIIRSYHGELVKEIFSFIKNEKRLAMIYGNCQTDILKNMLLFCSEFKRNYTIITVPIVPAYKSYEQIESIVNSEVLWQEIDLFIYQKIKLDNRFSKMLSTEYLLPKLRNDCLKVSISSVYFRGYFIQYYPLPTENRKDYLEQMFPFGDKFIDSFMSKKRNREEIDTFIEYICSNDFLSSEEIRRECEDSLQELKKREKNVDVKICDYIEKFYKKRQLFYSINHPDVSLLYEYTNRILEYLEYKKLPEISFLDMFLLFGSLKGGEMVIYPSVIFSLKMEQWEKMYFANRGISGDLLLDFKTYQKEYIEYYYEK